MEEQRQEEVEEEEEEIEEEEEEDEEEGDEEWVPPLTGAAEGDEYAAPVEEVPSRENERRIQHEAEAHDDVHVFVVNQILRNGVDADGHDLVRVWYKGYSKPKGANDGWEPVSSITPELWAQYKALKRNPGGVLYRLPTTRYAIVPRDCCGHCRCGGGL